MVVGVFMVFRVEHVFGSIIQGKWAGVGEGEVKLSAMSRKP